MDFNSIKKINRFKFSVSNYRNNSEEPFDGIVHYIDKILYFKYHHDYDDGNVYVVYDTQNRPLYYFTMSVNPDPKIENWIVNT